MTIKEEISGAMRRASRRVSEVVAKVFAAASGRSGVSEAAGQQKRRTQPLPSILSPVASLAFNPGRSLPKPTPANLRRFAETPIARKAINTIKDRVAGLAWRVQGRSPAQSGAGLQSGDERIALLTANFDSPNPQDSFRSLLEQVLEDVIVGGFGAVEVQQTEDAARPLVLWPVDGATIRIRSDWDGTPEGIRYVQATGGFGPKSAIELRDDELMYIRLNPRTHTPFGLGRLEVAFEAINNFLSAHRYAAKLASNSVVQYALWLDQLEPTQHERLIRWWQDEIEGTGRVPIMASERKPEVLRFAGGTDDDLRLGWQTFLLRIVADAFDLPPLFLGLEQDVNRSTATELSDEVFRTCIRPTARLVAEHITCDVIAKRLGWADLEFVFEELQARDELKEAQIQEILLRNGVMTVNEVRVMRGLEPV